jgi:hypothetical protein
MKPCPKLLRVFRIVLFATIFVSCLLPLLAQAISPFPPSYGIFLQTGDEWIKLNYQQAYRVPLGEMGYVIGLMHQTRVFLLGDRGQLRISDLKPSIYSFGANPADFYSLVRLDAGDGLRQFHYSTYRVGGSAKVKDEYLVRVEIEKVDKDLYRMVPGQELAPGEYGIVLGDSICPFGIDR